MKKFLTVAFAAIATIAAEAQDEQQDRQLTKEMIMGMTIEELGELPFGDLLRAVELLEVSSIDDLYAIIMNKSVASASKSVESAFESPLSTTVITREEMETYGCKSIEDAFRLIPGAIVTQKVNGVFDIQLRGLANIPDGNLLLYTENSNVLLMIDGRVVHNYSIGTMTMENLPVSIIDVDRIEVVRGAASALYGVNAVTGVINIITRRPSDASGAAQVYAMGGTRTAIGEVRLRKRLRDNIAVSLTANYDLRKRPDGKIPVVNTQTSWLAADESLLGKSMSQEDIDALIANGSLKPVYTGDRLNVSDFQRLTVLAPSTLFDGTTQIFPSTPLEYRNADNCFDDPELARRSWAVNGYVDFTPSENFDIRLSGGYSQSLALQTTVMESPYSLAFREFKKGYVNADARIDDLHVLLNFYAGPEDYATGRPGLQADFRQFFASAEYDFYVGDLNVRPGIHFQYTNGRDRKSSFDYGTGSPVELSGFFNDEATLNAIAPSLRLDYKLGKWRFVAALRADKTKVPDKWNVSAQGVVGFKASDSHFFRLNYGRAVRSANMLNANSNYSWKRTGMDYPSVIEFYGNKEADLVGINSIEFGYRFQPSQNLLVDAEAFFSASSDYGAMMTSNAKAATSYGDFYDSMTKIIESAGDGRIDIRKAQSTFMADITTSSNSSYGNLPYKVRQFGLSVNVDWVISPKVIAKLNANFQRTVIDEYYLYNQAVALHQQFYGDNGIINNMVAGFSDIIYCVEGRSADGQTVVSTDASLTGANLLPNLVTLSHSGDYEAIVNNLTEQQRETLLDALREAYFTKGSYIYDKEGVYGPRRITYQNSLALYYALKYGIDYKLANREYTFSQSEAAEPVRRDGHVHKSTPAFYGMAGVVVKPIKQLDVAAFANFVGRRTYATAYGTERLSDRLTLNAKVDYKPAEPISLFVAADNILAQKKQEFVYSDKIGCSVTAGVRLNINR
ncbi:MAG: TonB-dependent receptor plug domain-containing protein [Bacteroidales bacterium]|nr:TonB-dependent receptor plug domain-containing protein [Bacteroidales bacterium]MDY4173688.1 TonB-dependent receptor plug domain-containing protein [Bacteroidales bacterium]